MLKAVFFALLIPIFCNQVYGQSDNQKISFLNGEMIISGNKIEFAKIKPLSDIDKILLIELFQIKKDQSGKTINKRVSSNTVGGCMFSKGGFCYHEPGNYILMVSKIDKVDSTNIEILRKTKFVLKRERVSRKTFKSTNYISLKEEVDLNTDRSSTNYKYLSKGLISQKQ